MASTPFSQILNEFSFLPVIVFYSHDLFWLMTDLNSFNGIVVQGNLFGIFIW